MWMPLGVDIHIASAHTHIHIVDKSNFRNQLHPWFKNDYRDTLQGVLLRKHVKGSPGKVALGVSIMLQGVPVNYKKSL